MSGITGPLHLKANNWERLGRYALAAYHEECPILWLLDCDDDCARTIAEDITDKLNQSPPRQPIGIALLPREFETMFLYDFDSTKNALSIDSEIFGPSDPKSIRGAKGWINRKLPRGTIYKETTDQARITARLDIPLLQNTYSDFGHLCRTLQWLSVQTSPEVYPFT